MKNRILFIDDEQANLDGFYYSFMDSYDISLALSAEDALELVKENKYKVIISDQRMAGMSGIDFLSTYKHLFHNAVLIVLTAFSESSELISAINEAGIYRYVLKPWNASDLKITIDTAIEKFDLIENNDNLLRELEVKNKELEKALEKATESDRLKATFINNISHEVRTPMNGIMGFVNLIFSSDLEIDDRLRKYLNVISGSSKKLLNIIEDILDFSLLTNTDFKIYKSEVNIEMLLQDIKTNWLIEYSTDVPINYVCELEDKSLICDSKRLEKVFCKLLDNAIKYTSEGQIVYGVKPLNNDYNLFYVSDTGIGISDGYEKKIFEPFFQGPISSGILNEGNGLGLSIAKDIVIKLGGDIWLETEPNKGTSFYFKLPILSNS